MHLSLGSIGFEVKQLQIALNKLFQKNTIPLAEDGIFGIKTQARVKEFQSTKNLNIDGVVGPLTNSAIQLALRLLGGLTPPKPSGRSLMLEHFGTKYAPTAALRPRAAIRR
jgi:peptidoglycan DL-endopeptidase CwlO